MQELPRNRRVHSPIESLVPGYVGLGSLTGEWDPVGVREVLALYKYTSGVSSILENLCRVQGYLLNLPHNL